MIGGAADVIAEPVSIEQIATCIAVAGKLDIPMLVMGHGTNILFSDAGFRGLVVKIGSGFSDVSIIGTRVTAQAGAWMPGIAMRAMRAGLSGIEHTIGIPGTVGGLIAMNGGSLRQGIGAVVKRLRVVDRSGSLIELGHDACDFGYRSTAIQGSGLIVCDAELELNPGLPRNIRVECLRILRNRRRKFPRKERSCGSVFLSTPSIYEKFGSPGQIIERAGLKGVRFGGAEVSTQHANFILNRGNATATDVLKLIHHIRETVLVRTGVSLECEVKYSLDDGRMVAAHERAW
jgi:UDP-N-acetylmuramate dehydrogenase